MTSNIKAASATSSRARPCPERNEMPLPTLLTLRSFALHWRACERGSSPSVARPAALAHSSKSMQPEAAIGQFRPFIHVVARTSERRLHSDSGPSSNDAIRRAVGRCGPIRPIDNDHLRWVRSCAHHVHSGPSVRVADAAHNGVGPWQKENSSPRPSLRLRCPTTRNVDRHVASPLWRCSWAKQS